MDKLTVTINEQQWIDLSRGRGAITVLATTTHDTTGHYRMDSSNALYRRTMADRNIYVLSIDVPGKLTDG